MAVSLTTMYAPQNNGPHTALAETINAAQTDITVVDASVLPDAPNLLTIGTGEDAELVLMSAKTGNIITVTRRYNAFLTASSLGKAPFFVTFRKLEFTASIAFVVYITFRTALP